MGEAVPFPGMDRTAAERALGERRRGAPPEEPQDPAPYVEAQPETVGQILAHTRMKFGQDLRQASQSLRIRHSYLEAIEADRHNDLPGLAYAVGCVRSYADYLGLDSRALVQRYKDEAQGLNRKTQLVFPAPVQEAKVPTGAIVLIALILLGLAYGGWTYFSREGEPPPTAIAEPPAGTAPEQAEATAGQGTGGQGTSNQETAAQDQALQQGQPAPAQGTTGQGTTGQGTTGQAAEEPAPLAGTSSGETASGQPDGSLGGPLTSPIEDAATPAAPAPGPAVPGSGEAQAAEPQAGGEAGGEAADATSSGVTPPPTVPAAPPAPGTTQEAAVPPDPDAPRVILRAKLDSWVQIRNAEDEAILTQVLREGESYAVPNEPGLVLLTGNAGGLVIELDGKELPPLGAVGAVKRNVSLDPVALAN